MKNFVAPDMRTALKMVREELGADAVILSNRRVAGGIELLATTEPVAPPPRSAEPAPRPRSESRPAAAPRSGPAGSDDAADAVVALSAAARAMSPVAPAVAGTRPVAVPTSRSPNLAFPDPQRDEERRGDAGWWQMQQELRSMRDLIEHQLSGLAWQQYRNRQPAEAAMWRRLQRLGLPGSLMQELLAGYDDSARPNVAWQHLMAQLCARIPASAADPVASGGTFALLGPTGAGKTTTIAKLAARHVLLHGHEELGLVTLDSFRIGAHEQLRTLARVLNVPLKVATPQDLGDRLYELRHCRLILIDTAGLHMRSSELRAQLDALAGLGDRVQCLQLLAANAQQQVLRTVHRAYRTPNTVGCVLSKIDEAGSLGEVLGMLAQSELPLLYTTDGQAIPADIAPASAKPLVARAIELAKEAECDEEQLAETYARVGHRAAALTA